MCKSFFSKNKIKDNNKTFVFYENSDINLLNNLPNDLEELILHYVSTNLLNLPLTLKKIIINYHHDYSLKQRLSKNNIPHFILHIKVPNGCQVYVNTSKNELKKIDNFCGFVEYRTQPMYYVPSCFLIR